MKCPDCKGTGHFSTGYEDIYDCAMCGGSGYITDKLSGILYQGIIGVFPNLDRDMLSALSDDLSETIKRLEKRGLVS